MIYFKKNVNIFLNLFNYPSQQWLWLKYQSLLVLFQSVIQRWKNLSWKCNNSSFCRNLNQVLFYFLCQVMQISVLSDFDEIAFIVIVHQVHFLSSFSLYLLKIFFYRFHCLSVSRPCYCSKFIFNFLDLKKKKIFFFLVLHIFKIFNNIFFKILFDDTSENFKFMRLKFFV